MLLLLLLLCYTKVTGVTVVGVTVVGVSIVSATTATATTVTAAVVSASVTIQSPLNLLSLLLFLRMLLCVLVVATVVSLLLCFHHIGSYLLGSCRCSHSRRHGRIVPEECPYGRKTGQSKT